MESIDSRGYTLVEMLIVLAILVMVASLAWPSLRRTMEKSRLESAAQELQQQLNKARTRAIKTGETLQVSWVPGQSSYQIGPVPQHWRSLTPTASGEQALTAQMADPSLGQDEAQPLPPPQRSFRLPPTVFFQATDNAATADPGESGQPSSRTERLPTDSTVGTTGTLEAELIPPGSQTLQIYPDGRAQNTAIHLVSDNGYSITVHVRGLTGVATATAVRLPTSRSNQSETDSPTNEELPDSTQVNSPT